MIKHKYLLLIVILGCLQAGAQSVDSGSANTPLLKRFPPVWQNKWHYSGWAVPAAMIAYGVFGLDEDGAVKKINLSTRSEIREDHPLFASHLDDYLQYSPYAATYLLKMAGVKSTRRYKDQTIISLLSVAITSITVGTLKKTTHSLRPDGSAYNSFPSGHTANAFTGAELMRQQFSNQPFWLNYSGYALAAATGTLRVYNGRHWVSDVVTGAAIGILSAKAGELLYSTWQNRHKRHPISVNF